MNGALALFAQMAEAGSYAAAARELGVLVATVSLPGVGVDLHLSDEQVDLIGAGFDAALRIAMLEDSSLVVKQLAPVRRFIVAAPFYLERPGRPAHPGDLAAHHRLSYAHRARRDVWRITDAAGEGATVTPRGRCASATSRR